MNTVTEMCGPVKYECRPGEEQRARMNIVKYSGLAREIERKNLLNEING